MRKNPAFEKYIYSPAMAVIDVLLPPRCIGTGEIVSHQGMVAPDLWSELEFISAPICIVCGTPFALSDELDDSAQCAQCIETPPNFDSARAAMTYNEASRKLLLRFKYGNQQHAAITFAKWIKNAAPDLLQDCDYIIPVPLHWRRHWQRGFNQSAILANALSKTVGRPLCHALTRKRFVMSQRGLTRNQRLKNVRMAFKVKDFAIPLIKNKKIALIDDVITSGATVNECAKLLKSKGAKSVSVLTVAKVMREPEFYPDIDEFNPFDEGV